MNHNHKYYLTADLSHTTKEINLILQEDENIKYLSCISKNPSICEYIQKKLLKSKHKHIKHNLLNNPNSADEVKLLAALSFRFNKTSKRFSLRNVALRERLQRQILNCNNYLFRLKYVKHFNVDKRLQERILFDEHFAVRAAFASNPSITSKIKIQLMQDKDINVKMAILHSSVFSKEDKQKIRKSL